jgi:hypothetical protein
MRNNNEDVKPFNINVYIQAGIGLVISIFVGWITSTLWDYQIHKANAVHLALKVEEANKNFTAISNKLDLINNELVNVKQDLKLVQQNLKYLNNRGDMKGMNNHRSIEENQFSPPLITNNPFVKDKVQKASTSCDGEECIQTPVEPPKPRPIQPKPASQ